MSARTTGVARGIEQGDTARFPQMLTVSQLSKSFAGRALFDDVSLQVNRVDLINFSPDPLTVRSSVFTFLPYGSDNYFSSDKKAGRLDRAGGCANGRLARAVHSLAFGAGSGRRSDL